MRFSFAISDGSVNIHWRAAREQKRQEQVPPRLATVIGTTSETCQGRILKRAFGVLVFTSAG